MLFLSQLVGRPARDRNGEPFGKVREVGLFVASS